MDLFCHGNRIVSAEEKHHLVKCGQRFWQFVFKLGKIIVNMLLLKNKSLH